MGQSTARKKLANLGSPTRKSTEQKGDASGCVRHLCLRPRAFTKRQQGYHHEIQQPRVHHGQRGFASHDGSALTHSHQISNRPNDSQSTRTPSRLFTESWRHDAIVGVTEVDKFVNVRCMFVDLYQCRNVKWAEEQG